MENRNNLESYVRNLSENDINLFYTFQNIKKLHETHLSIIGNKTKTNPIKDTILLFYQTQVTEGDFFTSSRTHRIIYNFTVDELIIAFIEETTGWGKVDDIIHRISYRKINNSNVFQTQEGNVILGIYYKDSNEYTSISQKFIDIKENVLEKISAIINDFSKIYKDPITELFEEIKLEFENGEYNKVLTHIENFKKISSFKWSFSTKIIHLKTLINIGKSQIALSLLDIYKESLQDVKNDLDEENYNFYLKEFKKIQVEILEESTEDLTKTLNIYKELVNLTSDFEERSNFSLKISHIDQKLKNSFFDFPYEKRKIIVLNESTKEIPSDSFLVLKNESIPKINFPVGHPIPNELYIGHPFVKENYIQFSHFEELLFNDRFQEFSFFLQALGAKKIIISNKRGNVSQENLETQENSNSSVKISKASIELASLENQKEFTTANLDQNSLIKETSRVQIFNPRKKPYLPESLIWYPHESSWQRLYSQRMEGHILEHNEIISTTQIQTVSKNEKLKLEKSFNAYATALNLTGTSDNSYSFKEKETIEWSIQVEFAPIEELEALERSENEINFDSLPINEKKYYEEVIFMLEDDFQIDSDERRLLNKKIDKLNIEKSKAAKIEIQAKLEIMSHNNEIILFNEIKELLEDDDFNENTKRILLRKVEKLNMPIEKFEKMQELALEYLTAYK
ncbi:hypothetical protein SAMN04488104_102442 [Algoriphagus faecimaris]|uniref:Uncharacterized protein n=1 Tax=Algoriphagus faecimaris TaxID=686796 RepID=A0A1G6TUV2_9BACT|nr:hypothetical protein [Algoriphagus faecimaris]SDD32821.1 hypothetical protein SAMN04488104_102442 [Algoriphagus faecimaris]